MTTPYQFKLLPEAAFAGVTAVAILAFQVLADFDVSALQDLETYGLALVGAVARAFGAAGLNVLLRAAASVTGK